VDEKKLAELFNDAVRETPPPSFDTGDVRQASHRATVRHRNRLVAGSALALVLLGGAAITTVALSGGQSTTTASSPASTGGEQDSSSGTMLNEGNAEAPRQAAPGQTLSDRAETPKQGGSPSGEAGGSAGSTPSGCGQADRELAAALAGELPAAAKKSVTAVPFGCPTGTRAAAFRVTDGPRAGTISVLLLPPGTAGIAPFGIEVQGTVNSSGLARISGGTIVIVSQPTPELAEPPFGENTIRIAEALGTRF
jgi:hypothetical protein